MQDILEKFSTPAKEALFRAQELAKRAGELEVAPEHLFWALVSQRSGLGGEILKGVGIREKIIIRRPAPKQEMGVLRLPSDEKNLEEMSEELMNLFADSLHKALKTTNKKPERTLVNRTSGEEIAILKFENLKLGTLTKKIVERAVAGAARFGHSYVGSEHLLLGILETEDAAVDKIFIRNRVNKTRLKEELNIILSSTAKFSDLVTPGRQKNFIRQLAMGEIIEEETSRTSALDMFATNLTRADIQEKIDPVVGREAEILRLVNILSRRTKNNPILIGEPGVGKTAIVEGLAKKIIKGEMPDILADKKIFNLDLGLLVAGTSFRGDFENRLKHIIWEVKADQDIILFIDEIHNIMGAGSASGAMDAANILKPALSRGEIRCIGATTPQEYKKHIEPDPALERRFQPIFVYESTGEETIKLIRGIAENYERHHQIKITDEAIEAAVILSERYIQNKFLPDKAIDLIDEAGSSLRVKKTNRGLFREIKALKQKVEELLLAKEEYVKREEFEAAIKIKSEEEKTLEQIRNLKEEQKKEEKKILGQINREDIVALISKITKIPENQIAGAGKLGVSALELEERLNQRIVGQAEAVAEIAQVIRKNLSGLSEPSRPLGSFMFLGPSGVGKTEMAKVMAGELFFEEKALIRFDMSEFSEAFGISKLIGAPAGYVGYRESGKLTEAVKNKPYSIVLFDEIEKAHKEVRNLLLQIMEEGRLTDATGKEINFKNTIVVMTSNIGLSDLNKAQAIGFSSQGGLSSQEGGVANKNDEEYERVKMKVLENLKRDFNPEFLNRIDKTLVFRPLDRADLEKIVGLQIGELSERLKERGLSLRISDAGKKFIAHESFSADAGAREIRRKISDLVEGPLAEMLFGGEFRDGDVVKIEVEEGKIVLL